MFALIPARGGSKGIPGKNIKKLNGKPLIHYTIEAARNVFPDDRIIVSTDDAEIIDAVEELGLRVPFVRPAELARDESSTRSVILHALDYVKSHNIPSESIILLQPTSPFRNTDHIKGAIGLFSKDIDMVVSVKETTSNPYYLLYEEDAQGVLRKSKVGNYKRRQDCPKVWELNGAIYVINSESVTRKELSNFENIVKYEMDELSSHDIDTLLDWKIAELISNI